MEKLIKAIIQQNGFCSSSDLHSCSNRVNDNPLLSNCVNSHRLVSDLELALQDKNAQVLELLDKSVRNTKYGDGGHRHVSAAYLFNTIGALNESIDTIAKNVTTSKQNVTTTGNVTTSQQNVTTN